MLGDVFLVQLKSWMFIVQLICRVFRINRLVIINVGVFNISSVSVVMMWLLSWYCWMVFYVLIIILVIVLNIDLMISSCRLILIWCFSLVLIGWLVMVVLKLLWMVCDIQLVQWVSMGLFKLRLCVLVLIIVCGGCGLCCIRFFSGENVSEVRQYVKNDVSVSSIRQLSNWWVRQCVMFNYCVVLGQGSEFGDGVLLVCWLMGLFVIWMVLFGLILMCENWVIGC